MERLVLVRPPAYANAGEAADRFSRRSWLARRTVAGAPAASVICGAMCLLRPALQHAAPGWHRPAAGGRPRRSLALLPGLPRCAALRTLLTDNPLPAGIRDPHTPTTVVIGDQDMTAPVRDVLRLPPGQDVGVTMLAGTHLLLLENPTALAREIRRATLL